MVKNNSKLLMLHPLRVPERHLERSVISSFFSASQDLSVGAHTTYGQSHIRSEVSEKAPRNKKMMRGQIPSEIIRTYMCISFSLSKPCERAGETADLV